MHFGTVPASSSRPSATALAGLTAAAIVGAVIPALAGLAFLISLATRRPLIGTAARRWPWLTSYPPGGLPRRTQVGLTAVWGIGLLAAGAVQAAGAINGSLTITSLASFTTRALIALAAEAVLTVITVIWLHRKPAPRTLSAAIRAAPKRRQDVEAPTLDRAAPPRAEGAGSRVRPAAPWQQGYRPAGIPHPWDTGPMDALAAWTCLPTCDVRCTYVIL